MYRVQLPKEGYYHNLDLSESQFVDIVTGANSTLGIGVWNPEICGYVSGVTAEQAVTLYPVCWREIYP